MLGTMVLTFLMYAPRFITGGLILFHLRKSLIIEWTFIVMLKFKHLVQCHLSLSYNGAQFTTSDVREVLNEGRH